MQLPSRGFARLVVANQGKHGIWVDSLIVVKDALVVAEGIEPEQTQPNIIVFIADALRADALGLYGQEAATSPHLDTFAREAKRFDEVWAQSSWTRPSIASLMTGLQPDTHGVDAVNAVLAPELVTLSEVLSTAGFRTGAFVANHVVSARFGFNQGFDEWDESLYGTSPTNTVARALEWVGDAPEPFFLYVHTLDPHGPYEPSPEHWEQLRPAGGYAGRTNIKELVKDKGLAGAELDYLRSAYHAEVRGVDAAFGQLVEGLGQDVLDRSVVVFTADYGEEFRDHGDGGHGHTLYEEVVRVPLVIRPPNGLNGGSSTSATVQHVDLLPTLAGLAGAPNLKTQGRDLSGWLSGGSAPEGGRLASRLRFSGYNKSAIREGSMKLIVNNDRFGREVVRTELYDLANDPKEERNLAEERPIAARHLRNELELLREQLQARGASAGATVELNEEDRERLRALGYLGTGEQR